MLNITIFPILKQWNENGIVLVFCGNHIKKRIKKQKRKLFLMKSGENCNKKVKHMRNSCQLQCSWTGRCGKTGLQISNRPSRAQFFKTDYMP